MSATQTQVGGSHYKDMKIQPVDYIHANGIGFIEGCVIKYVSRHKSKNGRQDLEKAIHFLELLIEREYPDNTRANQKYQRIPAMVSLQPGDEYNGDDGWVPVLFHEGKRLRSNGIHFRRPIKKDSK